MSSIEVIAGDINKGAWSVGTNLGLSPLGFGQMTRRYEWKRDVARVELQTEEGVKKLAGTAGWGLAGLALLGPVGAIGGMLLGGRGKKVCFACYLKNGQKFLATTDGKTWQKIAAEMF